MRAVLLGAVLTLAACGDNAAAPPVVVDGDDVTVSIDQSPARITVVRKADGEVVFDGLLGDAVGTPDAPHVAAAFRAATPFIETQVGAFRIEDDADAPWTGVEAIQTTDGGLALVTNDGDYLGTLAVELVADEPNLGTRVTITVTADPEAGMNRTSIAARCVDGEHFIGLGGQSFDVDHRGQTVPLWVEEDGITKRDDDRYDGVWFLAGRRHSTHTPMPMMLSSRGYALAVETDARAVFALCSEAEDVLRLETWQDHLTLHVFVGVQDADDPRSTPLLASHDLLTRWTGRRAPPPHFAFAPWLDALYGEAEVLGVAQRLRAAGVPSSVIWTEDWRGGNDEGTGYVLEEDWRVDRDLYPNFEQLTDDLHAAGFKFLVYHNTFIDEEADIRDEAFAEGYTIRQADGAPYLFTGVKFRPATLLDLNNREAVEWAFGVYGEAYEIGADGWMADFAEWLPHDAVLADGGDPMLEHNRYPVRWAELNAQLISFHTSQDQVERLTFMRAGWLGSQPLVDVMWAGDQQTDFSIGDGMPSVIPIGLGLGVTGFPYYGHDIGGYMSQLTEPTTKELWFRWCTLGALSPVMRTHHGRSARMNWNWESDAETTAHLRRWATIHMQLVPYLLRMAQEFTWSGRPIMKPVALEYPDAGDWAWTSTDQFMLGDRILVAPVVEEGATSRDVTLPAGRWYPLLGGAPVEGGRTITVDAPITEIPAFVPAGAMLPLGDPDVQSVLPIEGDPGDPIREILVLFPGVAELPWHAQLGPLTWSGRDPALATPTTATVDGTEVPVVAGPGYVSVLVNECDTVEFEFGGTYTPVEGCMLRGIELRLLTP